MHGDFSRWTFDRRAAYRAVLLQQGRVMLDADWNEQTQIAAHHDETRTLDVVGRAGGPVDGAAFGVTDAAQAPPDATPWADLRITPGRFYVDGTLVEVHPGAGGSGPPLSAQPYLPGAPHAGLPEPTASGRYAVVLEVRQDHVTAEEAPQLRESALGGPDTTTRARTIWQLTLRKVDDDESCAEANARPWLRDTPPTMTASLADLPPQADPCRITTSAGYRRLENQLYRVQIHDVAGGPRYLWSRENGSVVAKLERIDPTTVPTMESELGLDREGRDEELSIRQGDVVEVTSRGLRLHGLPGHLAIAGDPNGLTVPVNWVNATAATAPTLASLGDHPIVRRWEGGPTPADGTTDQLEDGIQVRFGAGDFRVGDHWLIPARTVRLVYGQTALAGTIEWPKDATGASLPQPPVGPIRHRTVVALLDRTTSGDSVRWTLRADCRRLTPPLTQLVTLDLLGGDGQEALPEDALAEPVRVVARNGGVPLADARVRFQAAGGHLSEESGAAEPADPDELVVRTDAQGHAEVRWLLASGGPTTQVLTATLLDDADTAVGAEVRVSGRLSVATRVGYNPRACPDLDAAGVETVHEALDALCRRQTISFPGIHVEEVRAIADDEPIENDSVVERNRLNEGVLVAFDEPIGSGWGKDPVLRLTVDLPWPADPSQREVWGTKVVGTQAIALSADVEARGSFLVWRPHAEVVRWLSHMLRSAAGLGQERVLVRLTVLGNAVASEDGKRFLNGRAFGRLDGSRIDMPLPTVDDVHGADFSTWFWLIEQPPPRMEVTPLSLSFFRSGTASVVVSNPGSPGGPDLQLRTETETFPPMEDIYSVAPSAGVVPPGGRLELSVRSRPPGRQGATGALTLTATDPRVAPVTVALTTTFFPEIVPVRGGALRLKLIRVELADVVRAPEDGPEVVTPRLRAELEQRGEPLRAAVMPGSEEAFEALREALAPTGVTVERVDGEPADLVRQAREGALVLDAVVGGVGTGEALSDAVGPAVLEPLDR